MFFQAFVAQTLALSKLAALTLLLSLLAPKAVTLILSGFLFFGGIPLANAFFALAPEGLVGTILKIAASFLAQLGQFPLFTRFTDGGPPLLWGTFGLLVLQNVIACLAMLFLANLLFARRRI